VMSLRQDFDSGDTWYFSQKSFLVVVVATVFELDARKCTYRFVSPT
jgi:hypothetical protein